MNTPKKLKSKLRRVVEGIAAVAIAGLAMVGQAVASEFSHAPRATFTVKHYTAKDGVDREALSKLQTKIERLKKPSGKHSARSQALHDRMIEEFMQPGWTEVRKNLVTTGGKNDLLDKYFAGSSYTAAWYCGLISSVSYSAVAVGDTMASHAGWTEAGPTNAPNYSQSTRVALTFASASAGSKATSAASSFTFSGGGTIKGMFASSVSTKDGTTGILYNAVLFTGGDRIVVSTDVVNVSVTYSA
jgi:hypothetical protein